MTQRDQSISLVADIDLDHGAYAVDASESAEECGIATEALEGFIARTHIGGATDGIDTNGDQFRAGLLLGITWGVQAEKHRARRSGDVA